MKTTRYIGLVLLSAMMLLTGCKDYLTEIEPGKTMLDDYYTSPDAAYSIIIAVQICQSRILAYVQTGQFVGSTVQIVQRYILTDIQLRHLIFETNQGF